MLSRSTPLHARFSSQWALVVAAMVICLLSPLNANALVADQPLGFGFPRLAMQWPDPTSQPLADIARYDYVLLQPRYSSQVPALRALNSEAILLTSSNVCEVTVDLRATPSDALNENFLRIPNEWILTQLGSTLTSPVNSTDVTFHVADASRFRQGDIVVIEHEIVKVVSVESASLTVERGLLPQRSPADAHGSGVRLASAVVFWPGSIVLDLSENCPSVTVDSAVGPETWGEYNARVGARLLSEGDWDGIFVDRGDGNPSQMAAPGRPYTRSIDPSRSNKAVTDSYDAFNRSWREGLRAYQTALRASAGDRLVLFNNPWPNFDLLNGAILENFPRAAFNAQQWRLRALPTADGSGLSYGNWVGKSRQPNLSTLQTYEDESSLTRGDPPYVSPISQPGWLPNYKKMRFGLTTALMNEGFFSYELNTNGHGNNGLLWFDEYDNAGQGRGYLGSSVSAARQLITTPSSKDLLGGHGLFGSKSSLDYWKVWGRTGYALSKSVSSGAAKVSVTKTRGILYNATFTHRKLPVKKGVTYTLSFRAKAGSPRKVGVMVHKESPPYSGWLPYGTVDVGTQWKRYELAIPAKGTDSVARLVFGLGTKTGTVWFDDVRLQEGRSPVVYRRDFRNGVVLVNPDSMPTQVPLEAYFRKIKGSQAPTINSGAYVASVTLPPQDGIILLRTPSVSIPSNATIDVGSSKVVTGVAKAVSGQPIVGGKVALQSRVSGGAWTTASERLTSSSGGYSFSVRPTRNTDYRVRYNGDSDNLAGYSRTLVVKVAPKISNVSGRKSASRRKYYTYAGTLRPKHAAGTYPVRIYRWKYVSGKWKSYGYLKARASDYGTYTKYKRSIRLSSAGRWRLRAYHPADSSNSARWSSGYHYVNVK